MTYKEIIDKVAKDLNLSPSIVNRAYRGFWFCIKEHIKNLPLKDDLTEEDFKSLTTNFNIPSLGKLHCTYDKYLRIKKSYKDANTKED